MKLAMQIVDRPRSAQAVNENMPSFLYPLPIAIVAGSIALPILIHLINLMRHRRDPVGGDGVSARQPEAQQHMGDAQATAACCLLRIAAIAAAVLMVTQPIVQNKWRRLFGSGKLHHIVLLDDSFSMSDHWADTTAFDEAKKVIAATGQTMAPSSPAGRNSRSCGFRRPAEPSRGTQADLTGETSMPASFPKSSIKPCSGCRLRNWPSVRKRR